MKAFALPILAGLAILAVVSPPAARAAEPVVNQPKPVILQPAAPPAAQPAVQSGMENYSMAGMSSEQKSRLTQSVKRNNRQLGHGMGGLGEARPSAKHAKAPGKKVAAKPAKKTRKAVSKHQRTRTQKRAHR